LRPASGADLGGADLGGAKACWQSHDFLAEVLRLASGDDTEKRKVAGLVLVSRDWCWDQFLSLGDPLRGWALDVLAAAADPGDASIPGCLRERMTAVPGAAGDVNP
jgi:hypothetical protein